MTESLVILREIIKAQAKLLSCYRLGTQPPDWVLDTLTKYQELINEMS